MQRESAVPPSAERRAGLTGSFRVWRGPFSCASHHAGRLSGATSHSLTSALLCHVVVANGAVSSQQGATPIKRSPLIAAYTFGICLIALAVAAGFAMAARAAATSGTRLASGACLAPASKLTLKGKLTKVIPLKKLRANVIWDGRKQGDINPSLKAVYRGTTLYKLIGLVDDKNPKTFNVALAKKGYKIQFICRDGYKPVIPSRWIIKKKRWIVAKLKNGKLLPDGEAPFRFVGGPPITQPFNNKLSARMVVRIKLIF